jgi:hypothetical protein
VPRARYTKRFEKYGGYDCMTSAWIIFRPDGSQIVCVDCGDFGQTFHDKLAPPEAEEVAQLILDALNKDADDTALLAAMVFMNEAKERRGE